MKKLVMYSDQIPPLADKIDKELVTLLGKSKPVVGFIPSRADPQRKYYKERQSYYSRMGMDLQVYFELDIDYRPELLESLLACDIIHLSGGNTYYFLQWLRRREMLEPLRRYVKRGGVLVGVSAGSIIMSPDISVCSLWNNEPVETGADFSSLNLVDFAFIPHYSGERKSTITMSAMQKYSREHQIVVYACEDSGGIVVTGDNVRCLGDIQKIDER
jgi:dipeptidase E